MRFVIESERRALLGLRCPALYVPSDARRSGKLVLTQVAIAKPASRPPVHAA